MDWAEIKKTIWTYLDTWTTTSIMWPGQSVRPSGTSWIEVHLLETDEDFRRKTGPDRGTAQLQIGIFSKSENQYVLDDIHDDLSTFLHQKDLISTNYQIRFGELTAVNVPWKEDENIEKILQYRACTSQITVWEV